jgi:hypothetical protein
MCACSREWRENKRIARAAAMFQTHPQLSDIIMAIIAQ